MTEAERQQLFLGAQTAFLGLPLNGRYQTFAATPLNNAVILHDVLYNERLDVFDAVYDAQRGDLPATIAAIVAAVGQEESDPFAAVARQASAARGQGPATSRFE